MAERLVHDETPMEYFKQLVEEALAHQRVQSSEHTTFYVVNLLTAFVSPQREETCPSFSRDFSPTASHASSSTWTTTSRWAGMPTVS